MGVISPMHGVMAAGPAAWAHMATCVCLPRLPSDGGDLCGGAYVEPCSQELHQLTVAATQHSVSAGQPHLHSVRHRGGEGDALRAHKQHKDGEGG